MNRVSPLFTGIVIVLLAAAGILFFQNRRAAESLRALEAQEESTRTRYAQAIDEIAVIQDSLNAIVFADSGGTMRSSSLTAEQRLSPTRGDETMARVAELRAGIERTRERIQQLETRLEASGTRIAGLEKMVNRLKRGLADKEQLVATLGTQVDSLETHVTGLTATVVEKQTVIAAQDSTLEERRRELGTIYYAVGTKQELMKSGAVVARGGVLGLGKTNDPSGKVDETSLMSMDTDVQTLIPIPATKARVLTAQPADSYVLEPMNGQLVLRILDPHEFRKVRHLLILT